MDIKESHYVDYYIVFGASKLDHWIMKFLHKSFQHCYAVKLSPGKTFWIIVDPRRGFIDVFLEPVSKYPTIQALIGNESTILQVRSHLREEKRHRICVFNCVEVVKNLIGLDKPFIFTPRQLYKYLEGESCQA